MSSQPEPRYIVRELEGDLTPYVARYDRLPGLSVWVADEWYNGRTVQLWRSEERRGPRAWRVERMRADASELAARLNAEHEDALR